MEKIKYCPKCLTKFERKEIFCPDCGTKITERDPEIEICVEVERGEDEMLTTTQSEVIGLEEFFDIARKRGYIK